GSGTSSQGRRQRFYEEDDPRELPGRDKLKRVAAQANAVDKGATRLADQMRENNAAKLASLATSDAMFREYLDIQNQQTEVNLMGRNLRKMPPLQRATMKRLQNPVLTRLGLPTHDIQAPEDDADDEVEDEDNYAG
ncbi:hypothetical protein MKW92_016471, partial [Papaver armeniacum]